jgi:hypothetical protein
MDNRLRFLYHHLSFVRWGDAGGGEKRADGYARPSSNVDRIGKSVRLIIEAVMAREIISTEVLKLILPRKASRRKMVPVP